MSWTVVGYPTLTWQQKKGSRMMLCTNFLYSSALVLFRLSGIVRLFLTRCNRCFLKKWEHILTLDRWMEEVGDLWALFTLPISLRYCVNRISLGLSIILPFHFLLGVINILIALFESLNWLQHMSIFRTLMNFSVSILHVNLDFKCILSSRTCQYSKDSIEAFDITYVCYDAAALLLDMATNLKPMAISEDS